MIELRIGDLLGIVMKYERMMGAVRRMVIEQMDEADWVERALSKARILRGDLEGVRKLVGDVVIVRGEKCG